MLRRFICFSALLFIFTGFRGLAQNPVSRSYTVDDGLPSNEVYDIFEDSLGYLWFATDHGISRFDGYEFKNYSTNDGLTHNTIFGFFEDQRHRVWMRAFNSTLCYMENGQIYPYKHNAVLKEFLGRHFIQTFGIDSLGDLWFNSILAPFGLHRQDRHTGRITRIPHKKGFNAFLRELGGGKFISGVYRDENLKPIDDRVTYEDHTWYYNSVPVPVPERDVFRAATAGKGHYMSSHSQKLTEFHNGRIVRRLSMPERKPVTYIYGDKGNFWITGPGLYLSTPDSLYHFFKDQPLNCIRKDKRGSYWLASAYHGILYIPDKLIQEPAFHYAEKPYLLAVYKNVLYSLSQNKLKTFLLSDQGPGALMDSTKLNYWVHHLTVNSDRNELQLSGSFCTLNQQNPERLGPVINFNTIRQGMGSCRNSFRSGSSIYAAGNSGWEILREEKDKHYLSAKHGFSKFCSAICLDSAGTVWIGAADGLYRYVNGQTLPYRPEEPAFRQNISAISCMDDGTLVVSTRGRGLILLDGNRTYYIRKNDGLTTDLCDQLLIDGHSIWVCTNKGLNRILIQRSPGGLAFQITNICLEHGLPSNLIHDAVRYKDLLILATGKGLAWFDVSRFALNSYTPPVYIDAVSTNRRRVTADSLLSDTETDLSFGFTGLLYNNPGKVQYRYKLEGYESDWNYTTERSVHYLNLPAGDYAFVVTAMNENGVWSDQAARYDFSIPLHFTKTWWFLLFLVGAGLAVLWLIIRYYLKQRRMQEQMSMAMLMAELKTLRSQMKPHFVFNSLSSIQHFILSSDQESAHLYLSRFANLMRKILDNTSKDSISLTGELEMLELYLSLEKLRFGKEFDYSLSIDESLDPEQCEVPPMLIQPYIENAIWHGLLPKKDRARLWVRFYPEGGATLVCEVEDNGIGRKAAAEKQKSGHRSTGMKNIEERIGILNHVQPNRISIGITDLADDSGQACGTRVILKFSNTLILKP